MAKTTEFKLPSKVTVKDEGVNVGSKADALNFVGAGVTASGAGVEKTITIPGGLLHFDEGIDTAAPNGTYAATWLSPKAAVSDVVITPKNFGALILGPIPDNTTVGGNKRGGRSVDLCMSRTAASQVVSGISSFGVGASITVSGAFSAALGSSINISQGNAFGAGSQHVVAGTNSFALGFDSNITASFSGGMGYSNTVSNSYSFALGSSNTITSQRGLAIGNHNTNSGLYSFTFGAHNTADGAASCAYGVRAKAQYPGQHCWSSGSAADSDVVNGWLQRSVYYPYAETVGATSAEMLVIGKGGTNRVYIPVGKTMSFVVEVLGTSTSGTHVGSFFRRGIIRNSSGTTAMKCAVQAIGSDLGTNSDLAPAGWDVDVTADNTNDALKITVTGVTSVNISWAAEVRLLEMYRS